MGKLNKFQVLLNNPRGVFYPGEVVAGNVVVDLKEEMKMRGKLYDWDCKNVVKYTR